MPPPQKPACRSTGPLHRRMTAKPRVWIVVGEEMLKFRTRGFLQELDEAGHVPQHRIGRLHTYLEPRGIELRRMAYEQLQIVDTAPVIEHQHFMMRMPHAICFENPGPCVHGAHTDPPQRQAQRQATHLDRRMCVHGSSPFKLPSAASGRCVALCPINIIFITNRLAKSTPYRVATTG